MQKEMKSFFGYLEGSGKSELTIKNYKLDIRAFQRFLEKALPSKALRINRLSVGDVQHYSKYLLSQNFRSNTRRRKLLTVSLFLSYLAKRKKVGPELGRKLLVPHKIERIPFTISSPDLTRAIRALSAETLMEARNRCLLWTLVETGCLVSEIPRLRYEDLLKGPGDTAQMSISGKFSRRVPISSELYDGIMAMREEFKLDEAHLFMGFNKFGSLGAPISPRGIELLVKAYGPRLGFPKLTPRTFRHSAMLRWFQEGLPPETVQQRLGLKTSYSFKKAYPSLDAKLNPAGKPHVVAERL